MTTSEFDIYKYISLYNRHKFLFIFVALTIMSSFSIASYLLPKKYEARCTGVIEANLVSDLIKGITVVPSMDQSVTDLRTALVSRNLIFKTIKEVDFGKRSNNDYALDRLIADIQANTTVSIKDKEYFTVTFRYGDPVVARVYVNALVRNFIEQTVNANRNETYEAGQFMDDQLELFKGRVIEKEREINQFKADKGALANYDRARIIEEIDSSQRKLYDLKLRKTQLQEEMKASDPQRIQLLTLLARLNALRVQYTDNYPEVLAVKNQIEALQEELKEQKSAGAKAASNGEMWKIEAELKAISASESDLERNIASRQELLVTIPPVKASLEKLESERSNQKNMYDLLLIRQNQLEVSKQVELKDKGISYQITEPASTPTSPVSPNRRKIMLMGILAGLAGGVGLLLGLDYLDPSVRSLQSLNQFGIPVLAVIPLIRSERETRNIFRKDCLIYLSSGIYFLGILGLLVAEVLGLTMGDQLVAQLHLPAIILDYFSKF